MGGSSRGIRAAGRDPPPEVSAMELPHQPQRLPRLEVADPLRRHVDRRSGLRIAAGAYDRLGVEATDFETGTLLGPCHIYSSKPDARWIERDPGKLLPQWRDVVWARAGAYRIGRRFGETFDQTTYLADGETLVADRYRDHLSAGEPPRAEEHTQ